MAKKLAVSQALLHAKTGTGPGLPVSQALLAARGAAAPKAAPSNDFGFLNPGTSTQQPQNSNGLIDWGTDILSRPLFAVTNLVHDAINSATDQAKAISKGENPLQALGEQVAKNPLGGAGSALAGLFSTNPDAHRYTADVIEDATDKIGGTVDPNYVNTPNNVDPTLKMVAGLAGDIALDPTTYIPGAVMLKGLTIGKNLVKGAGTLAKDGITAAREAAVAKKAGTTAADLEKAETATRGAEQGTKDVASLEDTAQLADTGDAMAAAAAKRVPAEEKLTAEVAPERLAHPDPEIDAALKLPDETLTTAYKAGRAAGVSKAAREGLATPVDSFAQHKLPMESMNAFTAGFNDAVLKQKGTAEAYITKLRSSDPNPVELPPAAAETAPPVLPAADAKRAYSAGAHLKADAELPAVRDTIAPELQPAFDQGVKDGAGKGFNQRFTKWYEQNHGPTSPAGAQAIVNDAADRAVAETAAEAPVAAEATTPAAAAPVKASQQLVQHETYPVAQRFLQHLNEAARPGEKNAAEVVASPPMTRDQWVADESGLDPKATAAVLDRNTNLAYEDVPDFLSSGDPTSKLYQSVSEQLDAGYENYLADWRKSTPKPREVAGPAEPETLLSKYQAVYQREDGRALAEQTLGSVLAAKLARMRSPEKFQLQMEEIGRVVGRQLDLDDVAKKSELYQTTHDYLARLGIEDLPTLNSEVHAYDATSHVQQAVAAHTTGPASTPLKPSEAMSGKPAKPTGPGTQAARKEVIQTSQNQGDVYEALNRALGKDILAKDTEKFAYQTSSGAARTSDTYGQGYARYEQRLNTHTMQNIETELVKVAERRAKEYVVPTTKSGAKAVNQHLYGAQRAAYKAEQYMGLSKLANDMLEREGYTFFLGTDSHAVPISGHQIDEILSANGGDRYLPLRFNQETAIPDTNRLRAVQEIAENGFDRDKVADILLTNETKWKQGTKTFTNPLAGGGARRFGHHPTKGFNVIPAEKLLNDALDIYQASADDIVRTVGENATNIGARVNAETGELTEAGISHLQQLMDDPASYAQAIRAVSKRDDFIEDLADDAGSIPDSADIAKGNVDSSLEADDVLGTDRVVKPADVAKSKGSVTGGKKAAQTESNRIMEDVETRATEMQRETLQKARTGQKLDPEEEDIVNGDEFFDITRRSGRNVAILADKQMSPISNWIRKSFDAKFGMKSLYDAVIHDVTVLVGMRHSRLAKDLHDLAVANGTAFSKNVIKVPSTSLKEAWGLIRNGITHSDDPAVEQARAGLVDMVSRYFDPTHKESLVGNALFRGNTASVDMLNDALAQVGLKLADGSQAAFDVEAAMVKVGKKYKLDLEKLADQWRTWDVNDPLEMLLKYSAASERIASKSAMAQSFMHEAAHFGWVSDVPRHGFVKASAQGESDFIHLIDTDKYYDPAILQELRRVDEFVNEGRSFQGAMGKIVHGYYDPIQQAWKVGMTVFRPGHHIRNLIGDASMTYLAEGARYARRSNIDAIKILSTMRNQYDGVDFGRMLMGMDYAKEVPGGSEILSRGRLGDLSIQQLDDFAMKNGLYHTFQMVEDLPTDEAGKFAHRIQVLSGRGGRLENTVGKISEARDHYSRLQHFMVLVHKIQSGARDIPKFKDIDDAMAWAARRVKRYHPDGSMLTNFEAKYVRRIIPFYSWIRGAVPAVIESVLQHPARVTAFPKASYNLAIGMGLNPASLSDPFPTDQLFPSFLQDQVLGPQFGSAEGGYWGINPGWASVDVANQFFGNDPNAATSLVRGIGSAVSPVIRMPFELLSGGSWGTGAQISDKSDYLDSSIPGLNYLANISGVSPTGSIVSLAEGQGLDPQLQVSKGNKGVSDQAASAFNWFTGLGLQNMSRPNYIKYAEIEKRDAAAPQTRSGF